MTARVMLLIVSMDTVVIVGILSLSLATAMAGALGGLRVVLYVITRSRTSGPELPRS
jgi:hypothetical protein